MEVKEHYEQWHSKLEKPPLDTSFHKWLLNYIKPNHADTFLDVACGKGEFLQFFESKIETAFGIDISKTALKEAKKHIKTASLVLANAEHLPFKENSFCIVTCLGSLEHFSNQKKGINEIARVLKETGQTFILLPNAYFIGHIYMVYKTGESPSEGGQSFSESFATRKFWEYLLNSNGLHVTRYLKYNKITEASKRVSSVTRLVYNVFIAPFLPLNLSYGFVFICRKKQPRKQA